MGTGWGWWQGGLASEASSSKRFWLRVACLFFPGGIQIRGLFCTIDSISRGGRLLVPAGNSSQACASCRAASTLSGSMAGSCLVSQLRRASWGVGLLATRSGGAQCIFHTHPPFWVHRRKGSLWPFVLRSQISRGGSGPGFLASPSLSLLSHATRQCFSHAIDAVVVWLGAMPIPVPCM